MFFSLIYFPFYFHLTQSIPIIIMQHKFNIASFSSRRRSIAHSPNNSILHSPKSTSQAPTSDTILNNFTPKQYNLYKNILSSNTKAQKYRSKSQAKPTLPSNMGELEDLINDQVKKRDELQQFRTIYSIQTPEPKNLGKYPFLLQTKLQKDKLILKKLSNNPQSLASVYQTQLLQFYHYRDLQKQTQILTSKFIPKDINAAMHRRYSSAKNKIDIRYLQGDFDIDRHQKISKTKGRTQEIYAKHSEGIVEREKVFKGMRNRKEVKEPVRLARRSITYKRALNVDRIKYLIGCMNGKVEEKVEYQNERVVINGIFFKFSNREGNEKSRYKEITLEKFMDLFKKLELKEVTQEQAESIFVEALSYKSGPKILCKQDFLTIIKKLSQLLFPSFSGGNLVPQFIRIHILPKKSLYQQDIHQIYIIYHTHIQRFLTKSKIGFCLQSLFRFKDEQQPHLKDFYSIIQAFTCCSLIPPFESNKVLYFYSYKCIDGGIDVERFKEVAVMVAMSEELGLRNIEGQGRVKSLMEGKDQQIIVGALTKFFERCNIYQKVLTNIILPKQQY